MSEKPSKRLVDTLLAVLLTAALAAGLGYSLNYWFQEPSLGSDPVGTADALGEAFEVEVIPDPAPLACLPGIFSDASEPELLAPASTLVLSGSTSEPGTGWVQSEASGGGTIISAPQNEGPGAGGALPSEQGLSIVAIDSGPARSVFVAPCEEAVNEAAIPGGSTAVGEDALYVFVNPAVRPVSVTVEGFGPGGSRGTAPAVIVPARTSVTWRPGVWFPDEDHFGAVIRADGPGVATWLQSSGFSGEVTRGQSWGAAESPSAELLFPGIAGHESVPVLQILNVEEDPIQLALELWDEDGARPVPGAADFTAQPGVSHLPLTGLGNDPVTLSVSSSDGRAVAASLAYQIEGEPDQDAPDLNVEARALVGPAEPAKRLLLDPGAVEQELEAAGLTDLTITLALANPADETATLTGLPESPDLLIPPRTAITVDVSGLGWLELLANRPIAATRWVSAETAAGPLLAAAPLGAGSSAPTIQTVYLRP